MGEVGRRLRACGLCVSGFPASRLSPALLREGLLEPILPRPQRAETLVIQCHFHNINDIQNLVGKEKSLLADSLMTVLDDSTIPVMPSMVDLHVCVCVSVVVG